MQLARSRTTIRFKSIRRFSLPEGFSSWKWRDPFVSEWFQNNFSLNRRFPTLLEGESKKTELREKSAFLYWEKKKFRMFFTCFGWFWDGREWFWALFSSGKHSNFEKKDIGVFFPEVRKAKKTSILKGNFQKTPWKLMSKKCGGRRSVFARSVRNLFSGFNYTHFLSNGFIFVSPLKSLDSVF